MLKDHHNGSNGKDAFIPEPDTLIIEDQSLRHGFIQLPRQVLLARNLSHSAKLLYAVLLSYAWQEGSCFPGYRRLEEDMQGREQMLRKYMRELEAIGLVSQKRRGQGRTNIYILHDLKNVEESAFLNEKNTYVKSLVIIGLCFLILILSPVTFGILNFNFNLVDPDLSEAEDSTRSAQSGGSRIKFAAGIEDTGLKKAGDDIYGTPTIAKLGDSEIKIRIKPAGTELSIRDIQEVDLPDFSESYPSEIQAVSAESYEETIAKEDLELVRNYFNRLASN